MRAMPALPTPERLRALVAGLEAGLIERDAAVRLALLAALAGEHVLLIGPPGSAKSELARRLHRAFAGARYFERLLTRFSTPEELFGPLSLAALEHDRYERLIDGYLPTAGIAFLDEVFKANSAILNALLSLLNERLFDNGRERIAVPLVSVIGASNEVPGDEALLAFYDRFLLRVPVVPVSDAAFGELLALPAAALPELAPLAADERRAVIAARDALPLADDAVAALTALRHWLAAQGHAAPSDRRWRQLAALMKVAAATEGRAEADALDLWLAPYVVAHDPAQVAAIEAWYVAEVALAAPDDAVWLERAVQAFEQQLDIERQLPADEGDDGAAGKLALAQSLGADAGGAQSMASMRLVASALESGAAGRRVFSALHVRTRCDQVREVRDAAQASLARTAARRDALAARLAPRLWCAPSQVARVLAGPNATAATLAALAQRLAACEAGFAALPVDHRAAHAEAPAPVHVA
jgi:MoxR-like ATPase